MRKKIDELERLHSITKNQTETLKKAVNEKEKMLQLNFENQRKQYQESREKETQRLQREQQQQQQKMLMDLEAKKQDEANKRKVQVRQYETQKKKEEEAENAKTRLYFNFDPDDLSCMEDVIRSNFPNSRMYIQGDQLLRPCILFTFIPVNSRIDHTRLPTLTQELWQLAGGYSIVIRVHEESSQSYADNSMDYNLKSGTPYRQLVLKARYRTKWSTTGIGGNTQEFLDSENCLQTMKELIRTMC